MQPDVRIKDSSSFKEKSSNDESISMSDTAPGQLRVIKRNGAVVAYDESKISVAITKAFLAVEGGQAAASTRIHESVAQLARQITDIFKRRMPSGGTIHIEDIQDQVELALMRTGEHKIARSYVIYRADHARIREQNKEQQKENHPEITVIFEGGREGPLDTSRLLTVITEACDDLTGVSADTIYNETLKNLYPGVKMEDVRTSLVMTARTLVEHDPNYSYVTARLLLDSLRSEALRFLGIAEAATHTEMHYRYAATLKPYIEKGVELGLLSPHLLEYDLNVLGEALKADRDQQFTYLGLQTLYDRYFIHSEGVRFELPQVFFMRVAMGLASNEDNREQRAIEFYNLISSFDYMVSTPQLFNSGTLRPQLSSCFLTTVPDDLHGIYSAIRDNAMLSKWAGGLGNDWTPVRALGAHIKGTNGKSQGVVPFLKVVNDTAVAVNQGGKRKGAVCSYLETWHMDIEEFLELRKNTGDDRRRAHDMNTANWIPDLFMKRVFNDQDWTLFSPNNVPDLHEKHGIDFEKAYLEYERRAIAGDIEVYKTVRAKDLWRKMISMLFETGHPWITFKDSCNVRSPQQHIGTIHSSNLCTEITLNTNQDEIAVCNLGSVNLVNHINENGLDQEKLKKTITTAIRMLDNVIDINYYSVPQAENSNLKHRPVGMGVMGFQDALYTQKIPYASEEAVEFADLSMEVISYYAISASAELAADGAAAAIVTTPEIAKSLGKDNLISVKALQLSVSNGLESHHNTWDGSYFHTVRIAAKKAYAEAGITKPREEVSMMEVHDCFSVTELVTMEDLFISEEGQAVKDVMDGFYDADGPVPCKIDGGLKCFGHPIGASGLRMLYEMYLQLQGRADKRQLKNPSIGLTHNLGGQPANNVCSVAIIGSL